MAFAPQSFDPIISPDHKISGFAYIPTNENRLAWLNLELKGRLPGFKRRFLMSGAAAKSLAIFGEHEDDAEISEKKRLWLARWMEELSAINTLYYNLHLRIETALEQIDMEIEIIEDKIDDLERMGHSEEAQALREEKKALEDLREDFVEAHDKLEQADTLEELEQVDKKVARGENKLLLLIRAIFHRKKPAADFAHEAHIRPDLSARQAEAQHYYRQYEETAFARAAQSAPKPEDTGRDDDTETDTEAETPPQEPA